MTYPTLTLKNFLNSLNAQDVKSPDAPFINSFVKDQLQKGILTDKEILTQSVQHIIAESSNRHERKLRITFTNSINAINDLNEDNEWSYLVQISEIALDRTISSMKTVVSKEQPNNMVSQFLPVMEFRHAIMTTPIMDLDSVIEQYYLSKGIKLQLSKVQ